MAAGIAGSNPAGHPDKQNLARIARFCYDQINMSEEQPKFERPPVGMHGNLDEEKKKYLSEEIGKRFKEGNMTEFSEEFIEEINTAEYDKRSYEIDFINAANQIINKILENYGLEAFNIPVKNIHILPEGIIGKVSRGNLDNTAFYDMRRQIIVLDASKNRFSPLETARHILHEMLHMKGFISYDVANDETMGDRGYKQNVRRAGFMTYGSFKKSEQGMFYENFRGINEAIVSELEYAHTGRVVMVSDSPEVKDELKRLNSDKTKNDKINFAKKYNLKPEEITWIDEGGNHAQREVYRAHRKVLHYLAKETAEDEGKMEEEVLDVFFKAHFDGNIMPVARLVENSFGPNSFRDLGMMDDTEMSARRMLDSLKAKRRTLKKSRGLE